MPLPYNNILSRLLLLLLLGLPLQNLQAQPGQNPFDLGQSQQAPAITPAKENQASNPFDLSRPAEVPSQPPVAVAEDTAGVDPPFELLPAENLSDKDTAAAITVKETTPNNPFEIKPVIPGKFKKQESSAPQLQPQKKAAPQSNRNFLFWVTTLLLVLVTVLITLFNPVVKQLYRAFLNDNILKLKHREQGDFIAFPIAMLYLFFFLNGGFFIYLIINQLATPENNHWQLLGQCILGISGLFLLKHLVLRLIGYIFPVGKEISQYSFTIVVFNIMLGLFLIPVNLLIAFGPENLPKTLIYSSLFIILFIYAFRLFRSLLIGGRYIALHKFHFFMYLCTVEIAPTILLVKLLLVFKGGI